MSSAIKPVSDLTPGMLVARNVEIQGTVLLTAGTTLSESHIQRLLKWNVKNVAIAEAGDIDLSPEEAGAAQAELREKEKARMEDLFSTAKDDPQMAELKAAAMRYLEEKHFDQK